MAPPTFFFPFLTPTLFLFFWTISLFLGLVFLLPSSLYSFFFFFYRFLKLNGWGWGRDDFVVLLWEEVKGEEQDEGGERKKSKSYRREEDIDLLHKH